MAQVETEYERSLEEWGRDGSARVGTKASAWDAWGRPKCSPAKCARSSVRRRPRSCLFYSVIRPAPAGFPKRAIAVIECATAEEFLSRVRQISRA